MDAEKIKQLSQNATWLDSKAGQDALKKAVEKAKETTSRLDKERQVSVEDLHRHFTL